MQGQPHTPTPTAPPPTTPNNGAWNQNADGSWTWVRGGTPDPTLASQWGTTSLTDIRQDPTGAANHGSWTPEHGGGWAWTWGTNPDPTLASHYPPGSLSDPDHTPNGADTHDQNTPPAPNVDPPTVADTWNGIAPDVTGAVPLPPDGGSQPPAPDVPPVHRAYSVSPGSIRNVETVVLAQIDSQIGDYSALKSTVAASQSQNVYTAEAREQLISAQNHVLLQIGDVIELAGQYVRMLNNAAQNYAAADLGSFMPQD